MTKQVNLFGLLQIEEGGQRSAVMNNQKGCALFIYLLITQKKHSREALADLLWDAKTTEDSLRNLRQLLSRVRKRLPELEITRDWIGLQADVGLDVDLYHLEAGLASDDLDQQTAAFQLYAGQLLAGFYVNDAYRFAEWLAIEQEHWHRRMTMRFPLLCQALLDVQAWPKGIEVAKHWLTVDSLDEEGHRQLMRFLAHSGQEAAALAQYETCHRLLEKELGVEPSEETTALAAQIEQGAFSEETAVSPTSAPQPPASLAKPAPNLQDATQHLQDVPRLDAFFGRQAEQAQVEKWLVVDRCRLVAILGIGGMGKTTLAVRCVRAIAQQFDAVIWRSVVNALPLPDLLTDILRSLSTQLADDRFANAPPSNLDDQLQLLIQLMRQGRTLLIIDNLESLLVEVPAGTFRPGYEAYEQLLQRVATLEHNSHLLLTSRERPRRMARLMRDTLLVQTLQLEGLDDSAGHELLTNRGLSSGEAEMAELVHRYSGNPLALKLVVDTVDDLFAGDIEEFLLDESVVFDDIRLVLDQQFERLSPLEQELLLWLAVNREPMTAATFRHHLLNSPPQRQLLEALRNLQRRSLLEAMQLDVGGRQQNGFGLQNVVTEYLTDRLVETAVSEIIAVAPHLLHRQALSLVQAKAYVRQSQVRLILQPIMAQLALQMGSIAIADLAQRLLERLRQDLPNTPSYAGGNLLNLLLSAQFELDGYDFSQLCLWETHLRSVVLTSANLAGADLARSTFTDTFAAVYGLAYSPDGSLLASAASTHDVRLWSGEDGRLIRILSGHTDSVMAVAFSPDGELLASCGRDQTIRLWHVRTGRAVQVIQASSRTVWSIAFHPNGELLASGGDDGRVHLWDVAFGDLYVALAGHRGLIRAVAFAPDGQTLASGGDDGGVYLWQVDDAEPEATTLHTVLQAHRQWVRDLAFSPDGQWLASGGGERIVHLWEVAAERRQATLTGHTAAVRALAFAPDGGTLACASDDKTIRVWAGNNSRFTDNQRPRHVLRGHDDWAVALAYHPDSQTLATGSNDQTIRFWNLQNGQNERTFHGYANWINSICLVPQQPLLAIGTHANVAHLWNMESEQIVQTLGKHRGRVMVAVSPDGATLATHSTDQTLCLWDIPSGELLHSLMGHGGWLPTAVFSPDGRWLAAGSSDQTIYLWNARTGKLQFELAGHTGGLQALAFSPDGKTLASGSHDQTILLWDISSRAALAQGVVKQRLEGHTNWITAVAFSPDGQTLASGSTDATIQLWDIATGTAQQVLRGHQGWVSDLAFGPDGQLLASSGQDQTARLWRLADGDALFCLEQHTAPVYGVVFTEDGSQLISCSSDEHIRHFAVSTGALRRSWRLPRPYEATNIRGVRGLTEAQRLSLLALGAVES